MTIEVQVVVQAPAMAEVIAEGEAPVEVLCSPSATVEVLGEGTQGNQGLPGDDGADAVIPDPGDLILYLQNGLT